MNRLFLGRTFRMKKESVSHLREGEKDSALEGEITKILPPTPRYPQDPLFRVYFPELDIAQTYTWKSLKESMVSFDILGNKGSQIELAPDI